MPDIEEPIIDKLERLERWQIRQSICGECWCWSEHCPGNELD